MRKDDLELKNLGQYYGTQGYVKVLGVNVTDGIGYIMNNGYSWFVTDMIVVLKMKINEPFCSVKLKVDKEKKKAVATIDDGNGKILHSQKYDYTDAKRDLHLFFTNNVLMLSGEY